MNHCFYLEIFGFHYFFKIVARAAVRIHQHIIFIGSNFKIQSVNSGGCKLENGIYLSNLAIYKGIPTFKFPISSIYISDHDGERTKQTALNHNTILN